MAKTLKQILDGVKSSKIKNKDILGTKPGVDYSPKAGDERKFADKHEIEKHADRVGNGDDIYQGTNVKYSMDTPQMKNFGNTESEAEATYESVSDRLNVRVAKAKRGEKLTCTSCYKKFDPHYGEYHRCPDCAADQAAPQSRLPVLRRSPACG